MSMIRIAGGSGMGLDIASENPKTFENNRRVSQKDSADGNNILVLSDNRTQGKSGIGIDNNSSGKSTQAEEKEMFDSVMEELRQELDREETKVEFSYNQDLRQMVVTVTDKNKGSVVRQIPEEYVLKIMEKFQVSGTIEGLLINDKA